MKHPANLTWVAIRIEAVVSFLVVFGLCMNFSLEIKAKILTLVKRSHTFPLPPIILIVRFILVDKLWARHPITFIYKHVLLMFIFGSIPNHTPFKYMYSPTPIIPCISCWPNFLMLIYLDIAITTLAIQSFLGLICNIMKVIDVHKWWDSH